jgi:hypothetical protein
MAATTTTRNICRPRAGRRCSLLALALLLLRGDAFAQATAPSATDWTHGTTLNVFGGIGLDRTHTAGAAGVAVGWEVTRSFAIEGAGTWFDRGAGASGFAADLTALLSLRSPSRLVPYAKGGVGMYRGSFDSSRSPVPEFYRRRIASTTTVGDQATFTDPTAVIGGGVTAWASDRLSIRSEVDVKIVIADSAAHPVVATGVRIAYHFEDRPRESRRR